jgi:hypothetical protein
VKIVSFVGGDVCSNAPYIEYNSGFVEEGYCGVGLNAFFSMTCWVVEVWFGDGMVYIMPDPIWLFWRDPV